MRRWWPSAASAGQRAPLVVVVTSLIGARGLREGTEACGGGRACSAVYDVVIIYLLTELHSGYDLPWSAQNVCPTVFAGSKLHTQHYLTGKGFYQVLGATHIPAVSPPFRRLRAAQ